jgi:hypothetical protein
MSRIKSRCTVLFAVLTLAAAVTTTSAFAALPDIHVGAGGTYPVEDEGTVGTGAAIVGTLETEVGEKLTSTKVSVYATLTELSPLGLFELRFTGVREKAGLECHTALLAEGTVSFVGEYHVVYTGLATLTAGVLFVFPEQTVSCNKEKLKIKVHSPALVKLAVAAGAEVSTYKLEAACTKGKQEPREYYNEEAALTVAKLLGDFGLGFEKACYRGEPLTVKTTHNVDFLF